MSYRSINEADELEAFCRDLAGQPWCALDTEFIAENAYLPQLCLIQVAVPDQLVLIDAWRIRDLAHFWQVMAQPTPQTIVHGGRVEAEFCYRSANRVPEGWIDVQVAAGFVGYEFPAGYGTLVQRALGIQLTKHETRSNWRQRPLTAEQIEYALEDIRYLYPLWQRIEEQLEKADRKKWFLEEIQDQLEELLGNVECPRWWRLSGRNVLDRQGLAILRSLWFWREEEARRTNRPPKQILRDDLLVELARRKTADPKRIAAIRGLGQKQFGRYLHAVSLCIKQALELREEKWPLVPRSHEASHVSPVLAQLLFAALANLCRQKNLAPGLVGSPSDVRDWLAWRVFQLREEPPKLARGWRAQIVGTLFDELITGRAALKVADPRGEFPLTIISLP